MAISNSNLFEHVKEINPDWSIGDPEKYFFYHSIDLPESGTQDGQWDLREDFDRYTGEIPLVGKTVLDIGTAGGFLTFEAEKRGASVVSIDLPDASFRNVLPFPRVQSSEVISRFDLVINAMKNAYWRSHSELKSKAKVHYCDACQIPPGLGQFDVVLLGQIAVHLRDIVQLLTSAAARSSDYVVIAEGMIDDDRAFSNFLGDVEKPKNIHSFWHHSVGLYKQIMEIIGFELENKSVYGYRCLVPGFADRIDVTTLVFRRHH